MRKVVCNFARTVSCNEELFQISYNVCVTNWYPFMHQFEKTLRFFLYNRSALFFCVREPTLTFCSFFSNTVVVKIKCRNNTLMKEQMLVNFQKCFERCSNRYCLQVPIKPNAFHNYIFNFLQSWNECNSDCI